ncbi:hypothetical protein DMC47_42220 [Nostoc sp. 3335mG]|nr:hypothetical protein DMC47_42220 [Nostoc sp. 3335mG]
MTDDKPPHEGHADTHKTEDDRHKKARPLNAVGQPEPETEAPVARHPHPDRPHGERQDGPGAAPRREDRHDAVPAGSTHAQRKGADQGDPEEPDAAHRGQPALFRTGEASGSGASAGGTRRGAPEEPATDSAGGAGRD